MLRTCKQCKKSSHISDAPKISGTGEVLWVTISGITTIIAPLYFASSMEDFLSWSSILLLYLLTSVFLLFLFWSVPNIIQFISVLRTPCPRCGAKDWMPLKKGFH